MSLTTSATMIRTCLIIASLTVTWLALTRLNSATVHFAVLLRDCAKSDLVIPSDSILDITFYTLIDNVVDENCAARFYYGCIQIVVSIIVLSLGGWIASRVHGFQISFEFFNRSHILYYKIMYYGSVGQAAFGSLVIIISLVRFAVCGLRGH
ncbi:hypothetical protein PROQFM164_S02g002892 [Penicillium roqueforti FM164]|uniref:Uncharacterized protein n=1 Tax=Penicillium roqueforti (strain FM164) TaxID=1365484 RepID=W6Q9S4_PENRF|nr:hypothetical protein PROQFM164_S02g002892 [Penicillium roqueforti FM164]